MLIMKDYVFRMVDEEVELCSKIVKLSCFLAKGKVDGIKKAMLEEQLDAMNKYFDVLSRRIKVENEEEMEAEKEAAEKELQDIENKRFQWVGAEEIIDEKGNHWIDPRYPVSNLEK